MRLLVDLLSHIDGAPAIVQVQRVPSQDPTIGGEVINGKYSIPVPLDMDFPITSDDFILDAFGNVVVGSVTAKTHAHLLAVYPQYENIYWNPLLTSDHVKELVLDQSFHFTDRSLDPPVMFYPRFQTGREQGVPDDGQMPTHTALMGSNGGVTPSRPGFIITDEIDISDYTLDCKDDPVGTDEFMVYWRLYAFIHDQDLAADAGSYAGYNVPAHRTLLEKPSDEAVSVWLTTDDGANWCQVYLLDPVAFCDKTTTVRLAFRNDTPDKIFLATYALLF